LPNGNRVSQGTIEYFNDILREMRTRGRDNPNELRLANELKKALKAGKLDYVLVKGNPNTGKYAGYTMQKFDIG
jgi:ribosome biogenesis GTPase A